MGRFQDAAFADDLFTAWRKELVDDSQQKIAALNAELFTVHLVLKHVEKFKVAEAFVCLSEEDQQDLEQYLAPLIRYDDPDELALRFDNFMYGFMLNALDGKPRVKHDIATLVKTVRELLKLAAIPQVAAKVDILKQVDCEDFWKELDICKLEYVRRELRGLIQFIEKGKRSPIITSLTDPVLDEREGEALPADDVFENYEKKVNRYINEHRNTLAIHNLTHNIPLTRKDYEELERVFTQELGSREDYQKAFKDKPFGLLVRKIAKLDHEAALAAFAEFINDQSLNSRQIEFVKKVITHIEQNGYIEDMSILGKPPFDKPARLLDFDVARRKRLVEVIEEVKGNALVM